MRRFQGCTARRQHLSWAIGQSWILRWAERENHSHEWIDTHETVPVILLQQNTNAVTYIIYSTTAPGAKSNTAIRVSFAYPTHSRPIVSSQATADTSARSSGLMENTRGAPASVS